MRQILYHTDGSAPVIPDPYWIEEYATFSYTNLNIGAPYTTESGFVSGFDTYPAGEILQIKILLRARSRGYLKFENMSAFPTDVVFEANTQHDVTEIHGIPITATVLSPTPSHSVSLPHYDSKFDYTGMSGRSVFEQDIIDFTEVFDETGGAICAALNANAYWALVKVVREYLGNTVTSDPVATIADGTTHMGVGYDVKIRTLFDPSP